MYNHKVLRENIDYKLLFNRMLENECSPADTRLLVDWLSNGAQDADASAQILTLLQKAPENGEINDEVRKVLADCLDNILQKNELTASNKVQHRVHFLKTSWFRYAAILLLLLGTGLYLFFSGSGTGLKNKQVAGRNSLPAAPIYAVGNNAVLTLSDGSVISLDSVKNGALATQGSAQIIKKDNGEIVYQLNGNTDNRLLSNTMTTPRGGQYKLTLPDGTQVWLNAASSITYPTAFVTNERVVSVTGQAYFEVAENAKKPFKVVNGNMEIRVLGTGFDVNAYNNEGSVKTTLLQGSVKVAFGGNTSLLVPGQQAVIEPESTGGTIKIKPGVNVEQVVAWKNGLFNFKDADLPTVMRQLERWYDITVKYEGVVPEYNFQGKLTRDLSLQEVLDILGKVGVRFKMENKTLIVSP